LPCLEVLNISENNISTLSGLHTGKSDNILKFPCLREFIFSSNSLTSGEKSTNFNGISFLLELGSLRRVDLSRNQLTSIPLLGNIVQQLEFLDLRYNQISNHGLGNNQNIDTPQRKFYFTPQEASTGLS
jgi:Leucine-rich repeat (LRR) protein